MQRRLGFGTTELLVVLAILSLPTTAAAPPIIDIASRLPPQSPALFLSLWIASRITPGAQITLSPRNGDSPSGGASAGKDSTLVGPCLWR